MLNEILITRSDLIKYMGQENHTKFIEETIKRINNHSDYTNIKKGDSLWIIGEWGIKRQFMETLKEILNKIKNKNNKIDLKDLDRVIKKWESQND